MEGPCGSKAAAVSHLDSYIRVMESGLLSDQPEEMAGS